MPAQPGMVPRPYACGAARSIIRFAERHFTA
jgi:hypothetical protein